METPEAVHIHELLRKVTEAKRKSNDLKQDYDTRNLNHDEHGEFNYEN